MMSVPSGAALAVSGEVGIAERTLSTCYGVPSSPSTGMSKCKTSSRLPNFVYKATAGFIFDAGIGLNEYHVGTTLRSYFP
jgi:hypothetical protein